MSLGFLISTIIYIYIIHVLINIMVDNFLIFSQISCMFVVLFLSISLFSFQLWRSVLIWFFFSSCSFMQSPCIWMLRIWSEKKKRMWFCLIHNIMLWHLLVRLQVLIWQRNCFVRYVILRLNFTTFCIVSKIKVYQVIKGFYFLTQWI